MKRKKLSRGLKVAAKALEYRQDKKIDLCGEIRVLASVFESNVAAPIGCTQKYDLWQLKKADAKKKLAEAEQAVMEEMEAEQAYWDCVFGDEDGPVVV